MSKPRLTEMQIVALLKEAESGVAVPELCRRHNVGQSTFYKLSPPAATLMLWRATGIQILS
jgi:hypothetical protein